MRLDKLTTKFQEALTGPKALAVTRDNSSSSLLTSCWP